MKKKYPEIFFESRGGEGPLFIYYSEKPYGNAIDDESETGAGFFGKDGELKAVMFDHVSKASDHQKLIFKSGCVVEIKVKKGQVTHQILFPTSKAS